MALRKAVSLRRVLLALAIVFTCLIVAGVLFVIVRFNQVFEDPVVVRDPYAELSDGHRFERIEDEFIKIAEANRTKRCLRPALRDEALGGSAIEDMRAVIEGDESSSACFELLETMDECLDENLFSYNGAYFRAFPPRHYKALRPLSEAAAQIDGLDEALEVCGPMIGRLRHATRHEDACGPYLPGVRLPPENYLSFMRLTKLVIARSRAHVESGDWEEAVFPLLDVLRFGQDLHRGGTNMIDAMIAVATAQMVVAALESFLSDPRDIPQDLLERIDIELAALLESEPHPGTFLRGETVHAALQIVIPAVRGGAWIPPGGKDPDYENEDVDLPIAGGLLGLEMSHNLLLTYNQHCPSIHSPHRCRKSVSKFLRTDKQLMLDSLAEEIEGVKGMEVPGQAGRVVRDLIRTTIGAFVNYVRRHGMTGFRLAALRVAARYKLLSQRAGSSLTRDAFFEEPMVELLLDPYSKEQMRVEQLEEGRFVLRPAVRIHWDSRDEMQPLVFIRSSEETTDAGSRAPNE